MTLRAQFYDAEKAIRSHGGALAKIGVDSYQVTAPDGSKEFFNMRQIVQALHFEVLFFHKVKK